MATAATATRRGIQGPRCLCQEKLVLLGVSWDRHFSPQPWQTCHSSLCTAQGCLCQPGLGTGAPTCAWLPWERPSSARHCRSRVRQDWYSSLSASSSERSSEHCGHSEEGSPAAGVPWAPCTPRAPGLLQWLQRCTCSGARPSSAARVSWGTCRDRAQLSVTAAAAGAVPPSHTCLLCCHTHSTGKRRK